MKRLKDSEYRDSTQKQYTETVYRNSIQSGIADITASTGVGETCEIKLGLGRQYTETVHSSALQTSLPLVLQEIVVRDS